jgi:hypothetical protein
MRKLVFILIASIAAVTFIRAFDNNSGNITEPRRDLSVEALNFGLQH